MLELALAVALSAVLLTAFFSASRALLQGLIMSADGLRGPAEAAEAMDQITYDVEQMTLFTATTSYSIAFNTAYGSIAYRLFAQDNASQDIILERAFNGASRSIGPRRMIANFNPYNSPFVFTDGVTSYAPVPLIATRGATSATGPMLDIQLVLQPNQTAPISYLRTVAFVYGRTTW